MDDTLDFVTTGGNIARLVNAVINVGVQFIYDPNVDKWYPVTIP